MDSQRGRHAAGHVAWWMRIFIGSEAVPPVSVCANDLSCARLPAVFPDVYGSRGPRSPPLRRRTHGGVAVVGARGGGRGARGVGAPSARSGSTIDAPVELIWANDSPPPGVMTRATSAAAARRRRSQACRVTTADAHCLRPRSPRSVRRGRRPARRAGSRNAISSQRTWSALADEHPQRPRVAPRSRTRARPRRRRCGVAEGDVAAAVAHPRRVPAAAARRFRSSMSPTASASTSSTWGGRTSMIAVEYDGDHHRERSALAEGHRRARSTSRTSGWTHIRVVAGDRAADDVCDRVRRAWAIDVCAQIATVLEVGASTSSAYSARQRGG